MSLVGLIMEHAGLVRGWVVEPGRPGFVPWRWTLHHLLPLGLDFRVRKWRAQWYHLPGFLLIYKCWLILPMWNEFEVSHILQKTFILQGLHQPRDKWYSTFSFSVGLFFYILYANMNRPIRPEKIPLVSSSGMKSGLKLEQYKNTLIF